MVSAWPRTSWLQASYIPLGGDLSGGDCGGGGGFAGACLNDGDMLNGAPQPQGTGEQVQRLTASWMVIARTMAQLPPSCSPA